MSAEKVYYQITQSPIGEFIAGATSTGCCVFEFHDRGGFDRVRARVEKRYGMEMLRASNDLVDMMIAQVQEYFSCQRRDFTLPLQLNGTAFELAVWNELQKIPYGCTTSYGRLAQVLGKPGASRAVGRANGANYLAIIVPCHRVIEADGSLRGYGGGLWRKKYLLDLEQGQQPLSDELIGNVQQGHQRMMSYHQKAAGSEK